LLSKQVIEQVKHTPKEHIGQMLDDTRLSRRKCVLSVIVTVNFFKISTAIYSVVSQTPYEARHQTSRNPSSKHLCVVRNVHFKNDVEVSIVVSLFNAKVYSQFYNGGCLYRQVCVSVSVKIEDTSP